MPRQKVMPLAAGQRRESADARAQKDAAPRAVDFRQRLRVRLIIRRYAINARLVQRLSGCSQSLQRYAVLLHDFNARQTV